MGDVKNITLRLNGGDISPKMISLGSLICLIESFKKALCFDAPRNTKDQEKALWNISLVSIKKGSAMYGLDVAKKPYENFKKITEPLKSGNYNDLPIEAIEPLQSLQKLCKDTGWDSIVMSNGVAEAVITKDTKILKKGLLKDRTVVYGEVIRVGGVDPKVTIKVTDKSTISCSADQDTVEELGRRLYKRVGLKGLAERHIADMSIETFAIEEVLPYKETPITEALASISPILFPYWQGLSNDEIVKKIRKMRDE